MDLEKIKIILNKYDIESEDDLTRVLDSIFGEESELAPEDRGYCLKNNFFPFHNYTLNYFLKKWLTFKLHI